MVDIVIPTYNPDKKLIEAIEMLNKQTITASNIFIINTKSDNCDAYIIDKVRSFENVVFTEIRKSEFDHGATRNLGASFSNSEYILFMTQDAVPTNELLIENLTISLSANKKTAIAYAKQIAFNNADNIERLTRNFNYPDISLLKHRDKIKELGIKTYFCSNTCAIYNRDIFNLIGGFPINMIFNEDMILASKIVNSGYNIEYNAEAVVSHSHNFFIKDTFSRYFDLGVSQKQNEEIFRNISSENEGKKLLLCISKGLISEKKTHEIVYLFFQSLVKYCGYKCGLNYKKLPFFLIQKLSLNKDYWKRISNKL